MTWHFNHNTCTWISDCMNKKDQLSRLSYSSTLDALDGFLNDFDTCIHFGQCTFILAAACHMVMFVISTFSRCVLRGFLLLRQRRVLLRCSWLRVFPWLRFHRTPLGKENVKLDIEVSCLEHTRSSPVIHGMVIWRLQINIWTPLHILYMFLYLYRNSFLASPKCFRITILRLDLTLGVEGCWSERLSISQNLVTCSILGPVCTISIIA